MTRNSLTFTLIFTHYGNPDFLNLSLSKVIKYLDSRIIEVLIINQNREVIVDLKNLPLKVKKLEYEFDHAQISKVGHDHASSLDKTIRTHNFISSHVAVMDSDCFPTRIDWLPNKDECYLASDPKKAGFSHPCFMVLPVRLLKNISFSQGLLELGIDTGRLIALQLVESGHKVKLLKFKNTFGGLRGQLYYEVGVYHHGSGSFKFSTDSRLKRQYRKERFFNFMKRLAAENFTVSPLLYFDFALSQIERVAKNTFKRS